MTTPTDINWSRSHPETTKERIKLFKWREILPGTGRGYRERGGRGLTAVA